LAGGRAHPRGRTRHQPACRQDERGCCGAHSCCRWLCWRCGRLKQQVREHTDQQGRRRACDERLPAVTRDVAAAVDQATPTPNPFILDTAFSCAQSRSPAATRTHAHPAWPQPPSAAPPAAPT
jgi:hypothetical protein